MSYCTSGSSIYSSSHYVYTFFLGVHPILPIPNTRSRRVHNTCVIKRSPYFPSFLPSSIPFPSSIHHNVSESSRATPPIIHQSTYSMAKTAPKAAKTRLPIPNRVMAASEEGATELEAAGAGVVDPTMETEVEDGLTDVIVELA